MRLQKQFRSNYAYAHTSVYCTSELSSWTLIQLVRFAGGDSCSERIL